MATPQQTHPEEHFRETGKFKPINEYGLAITERPSQEFIISSIQQVGLDYSIQATQNAQFWRMYVEDNINSYRNQDLISILTSGFKVLSSSGGLDDLSQSFFNASGLLMQRIKDHKNQYKMSMLDYNCTIVRTTHVELKFSLDVYILTNRSIEIQKDFTEETYVKMKDEYFSYFLTQRAKVLSITKDAQKMHPSLEISDNNLEESFFNLEKYILTIKNLSVRIFTLKFQEERFSRSNQPLEIMINNKEIYQYILQRTNRTKYLKYRVQQNEGKEWHSFDNNLQRPSKKQNKTTPDKNKGKVPNKISILSTNGVEESKQSETKKILMVGQPRHLKISQRVVTNPKQSNLVPSELDYPVSVKDEKQKDNPYLDQFQNLLYEEDVEENQLSLNDSFEEFQKKQNSEKNLQIINELNKRKVKETEEMKMLDSLKQKIKELISQQKQWINKNLKIKLEIKKLKNPQNQDKNKEIQEIKQKIEQLKIQQSKLIDELAEIKKNNSIEMIFFGDQLIQQSSQSQRGKEKLFHSINNLQLQPGFNPLTTSVRSNAGNAKSPQPFPTQQSKAPFPTAQNLKSNFRPNFPQSNSNFSPISLYSSVPTQSFIQPGNYQYSSQTNQMRFPPSQIINDQGGNLTQKPNLPNQNPYMNSPYNNNHGNFIGSPMGGKKPSMQLFSPQPNKN